MKRVTSGVTEEAAAAAAILHHLGLSLKSDLSVGLKCPLSGDRVFPEAILVCVGKHLRVMYSSHVPTSS